MDNDQTSKKSWTSPVLEALEMQRTAGGDTPDVTEQFTASPGPDS